MPKIWKLAYILSTPLCILAGMALILPLGRLSSGSGVHIPEIAKLRPEMVKICQAESGSRQFQNGKVLRGVINHNDIGYCQINTFYWEAQALKLGFNIFTQNGNINMANWIYEHYGTSPWNWSKSTWYKDEIMCYNK